MTDVAAELRRKYAELKKDVQATSIRAAARQDLLKSNIQKTSNMGGLTSHNALALGLVKPPVKDTEKAAKQRMDQMLREYNKKQSQGQLTTAETGKQTSEMTFQEMRKKAQMLRQDLASSQTRAFDTQSALKSMRSKQSEAVAAQQAENAVQIAKGMQAIAAATKSISTPGSESSSAPALLATSSSAPSLADFDQPMSSRTDQSTVEKEEVSDKRTEKEMQAEKGRKYQAQQVEKAKRREAQRLERQQRRLGKGKAKKAHFEDASTPVETSGGGGSSTDAVKSSREGYTERLRAEADGGGGSYTERLRARATATGSVTWREWTAEGAPSCRVAPPPEFDMDSVGTKLAPPYQMWSKYYDLQSRFYWHNEETDEYSWVNPVSIYYQPPAAVQPAYQPAYKNGYDSMREEDKKPAPAYGVSAKALRAMSRKQNHSSHDTNNNSTSTSTSTSTTSNTSGSKSNQTHSPPHANSNGTSVAAAATTSQPMHIYSEIASPIKQVSIYTQQVFPTQQFRSSDNYANENADEEVFDVATLEREAGTFDFGPGLDDFDGPAGGLDLQRAGSGAASGLNLQMAGSGGGGIDLDMAGSDGMMVGVAALVQYHQPKARSNPYSNPSLEPAMETRMVRNARELMERKADNGHSINDRYNEADELAAMPLPSFKNLTFKEAGFAMGHMVGMQAEADKTGVGGFVANKNPHKKKEQKTPMDIQRVAAHVVSTSSSTSTLQIGPGMTMGDMGGMGIAGMMGGEMGGMGMAGMMGGGMPGMGGGMGAAVGAVGMGGMMGGSNTAVLGMMEEMGIAPPPALTQKYLDQEQLKAQQALRLQQELQQEQHQQHQPLTFETGLQLVKANPKAATLFIDKLGRRGFFEGARDGSDEYKRRYAKAVSAFAKQQQMRK
jgi:hypothetical protein